MINVDFKTKHLRLIASLIRVKPISEMGKLANQLAALVDDTFDDDDVVTVPTTPETVHSVYMAITQVSSEIDEERADMRTILLGQIMANMSITTTPNEWDTLLDLVSGIQASLASRLDDRVAVGKAFLESLR